jgi:hypothetical protein
MKNTSELPLFVASLVSNAYELNSWIPNTHMMFYKMFCSPKINEEERSELEKEDLLAGNIFNHHVSTIGYKSLLHSVMLTGKKKHLKKILLHMHKHLPADQVTDEIVEKVIDVAVHYNFPILLGKTMKQFLADGVQVSKENYVKFYMYLDRCKGLEKDTLRFIFAANDTEHIQMDWEFVKPLFSRAIKYKKGKEILELFEQVKQKMRLNKKYEQLPAEEQTKMLDDLKAQFYKELIYLLLERNAYEVSDLVFLDYRTQFKGNEKNDLMGLQISCLKNDIDLFEKNFNETLNPTATGGLLKTGE